MSTSLSIKNKILYGLNIDSMSGLEIGPLMNPLVSKKEGNVSYVDRATTEEIKEWYSKNEAVDLQKIVDVDYVWGDKSLAQATEKKGAFDYCVAAHVIEHVPDLIGWLLEISEILKENGIASFSVPDRRYTFDYLRPETVTADLVEAYQRKLKKPSIRHIYDHFSSFTEINIVDAWSDNFTGEGLKPIKSPKKVLEVCKDAQQHDKYIDSHCWVFTTESFINILDSLNQLGLLDFRIKRFFTVDYLNFEFVVQLEKLPEDLSYTEKRRLFTESLSKTHNHLLQVEFLCYPSGEAQVYFDIGNDFNEKDSCTSSFCFNGRKQSQEFTIPPVQLNKLRFDPVKKPAVFKIFSIELFLFGQKRVKIPLDTLNPGHHLKTTRLVKNGFWGMTYRKAADPFVLINIPEDIKNNS